MREDPLIASFYESAVGRGNWSTVLDDMALQLGCFVVQIIGVDLTRGRLTYSFENAAVPAGSVLDYALRYHHEDPHVRLLTTQPVGDLVRFSDVFDEDFVAESRFYQDFLIPYGVRHMHAAKLFDDGKRAALVGIMRTAERGVLRDDAWDLARRLCFHLARALALYEQHTLNQARLAIGQAVFDRIAVPTWVLDDRRGVIRCNASSALAAASTTFVRLDTHDRLHVVNAADDTRFGEALASIVGQRESGSGASMPPPTRVVLPLGASAGGPPVVLRLLAIHPDQTLHAFGSSAVAMVMLHEPGSMSLPDIFMLSAAFGLTPAEARVAIGLANGSSPKSIASEHGVSINTVQTQIRRACDKAGVNRVVDLVAALHVLSAGIGG